MTSDYPLTHSPTEPFPELLPQLKTEGEAILPPANQKELTQQKLFSKTRPHLLPTRKIWVQSDNWGLSYGWIYIQK